LLGVFVNYIFLYVALIALCPLMHFLGGHGGHEGSSGPNKQLDPSDQVSRKEEREECH